MGGRSIAVALAALALSAAPASADTRVVDQWLGPYTTINAALAASAPGDTVEVHEGIYDEQLSLDQDDLTIRAVGRAVVRATGPYVVSLMGARATLRGLLIDAGPHGVRMNGDDATLEDVTVIANDTGVEVTGGTSATLRRTFVRATEISGTALRAHNRVATDRRLMLDNSVLVGGRLGTALDLMTGE